MGHPAYFLFCAISGSNNLQKEGMDVITAASEKEREAGLRLVYWSLQLTMDAGVLHEGWC